MKRIYNEGRVVGLSSYELYIRQLMSLDRNAKPLTERQWLSASIAPNFSMILKIPAGTEAGVHNYVLPEGSMLCACSTIFASIFEGGVELDHDMWAAGIDDYGRLVENVLDTHPETPGEPEDVPTKTNPTVITDEFAEQCRNYMKINSGLVLQPGKWGPNIGWTEWLTEAAEPVITEDTEETILVPVPVGDAAVGLAPDLTKRGFVRFAISEDITSDFYILLNGFAYKPFINGTVGYTEIQAFMNPQDGDFLGPALFPWASKIVLITTNEVTNVMINDLKAQIAALSGGND